MMTKRRVIEEVKSMETPTEIQKQLPEATEEQKEYNDEFHAEYNSDNQTVSFELSDGTPVVLKSPKVKQFGLLESFVKQSPQEYLTDMFTLLKLASLCTVKYGKKESISFDDLVDNLEIEDLERMVAALGFFRDKLNYLTRKKGATV